MASSSSSSEKNFTFKSSDKEFTVKESIAVQFGTIKRVIEDDDDATATMTIPLPNVDSETLTMVIEYCAKHADSKLTEEDDLRKFDSEFVMKKDMPALFQLVLAANYLDVKGLLELICQRIADTIKDLMPEEVRKIFNIENDFTPEEEAAIRKENQWAFEV